MISFIPLASGSSGNSVIIETAGTKIIVDMGISYGRFVKNINSFGMRLQDFSRLYITHAHFDHISGLFVFLKKSDIPVYTRRKTKEVLINKYPKESSLLEKINIIDKRYCQWQDVKVSYFKLPHRGWGRSEADDTGENIGFVFESAGHKLAFLTDCGHLTENVKDIIRSSNAYVIESNYDEEMQTNSSRPLGLKKRIMSDFGHLSNTQTAEYLMELVDSTLTRKVFLAHMSRDCNTREKAENAIRQKLVIKYGDNLPFRIVSELQKRYNSNPL